TPTSAVSLDFLRRAHVARAFALLAGCAAMAIVGVACSRGDQPRAALAASAPARVTGGDTTIISRADAGRTAGSEGAKVWLIEISDFQCPYCRQWHDSTYPTIRREYVDAGKVRMAYVNLPLSMHANAMPAAEAAMC